MGQAFFSLDKRWALDLSGYSPELQRQMVWLSGLLPYAQAEAVMRRIGKRTSSDSSLWRAVAQQGQRLDTVVEPTPPTPVGAETRDGQWTWGQMLSMDGGMVNIRHEGWKELKVGLIGDVVSIDPPEPSVIPEVHTVPRSYTAVLGDVEAFALVLVHAAQSQGFFDTAPSRIPADGAAWIWGIADRDFPQSTQIVDWYHARQHLADAAQARFPDQPTQAAAWLQTQSDVLFEGPLDPLLTELNQVGLVQVSQERVERPFK